MATPTITYGTAHTKFYKKIDSGNYYYHCEAEPAIDATDTNNVWTIFREHKTTGDVDCPVVNGAVKRDGHAIDSVASLTYFYDL